MLNTVFSCDCNLSESIKKVKFDLLDRNNTNESKIIIKEYEYQANVILEDADTLIRIIRKNWHQMQSVVLYNKIVPVKDLLILRGDINKSFHAILYALNNCQSNLLKTQYIKNVIENINNLEALILPLSDLHNVLMKLANNKTNCPIYQYLHTRFEIKYYMIKLNHRYSRTESFREHLNVVAQDLILLGLRNYEQSCKSAFFCPCVKCLWLIIYNLINETFGNKHFWELFNKNVKGQQNEFNLWLLKELAELFYENLHEFTDSLDVEPNYVLLENCLKDIVTNSDSIKLLEILKVIDPLVCNYWLKFGKIEVFQILWDYFSKRLNYSTKVYNSYSVVELVEIVDTVLWAYKDCNEDFEYFLGMLVIHLTENQMQWGRIKGRIYSQLGPNKVKELNYVGILHISLLFVCLTRVNFEELSKKFIAFVGILSPEKQQSKLIWNFYLTFIIRYIRENRSIEFIAEPFLKLINEALTSSQSLVLIRNFVNDLEIILKYSQNLQLQQSYLINQWIPKYTSCCHISEVTPLIKILINIFECVNEVQVWSDWEESYKSYVYPSMKYICSSFEAPGIGGILVAKIVLVTPSLLGEAFNFFCSDSLIPDVSFNFLNVILEDYPNRFTLTQNQEILALQSWTRICFLMKDDSAQLTSHILKLNNLPAAFKPKLKLSNDPIYTFIEILGENVDEYKQSMVIKKLVDVCFGQADRWIIAYISKCENEAMVLRIFTCFALAIHSIGPLLYNKHKTSCPYTKLISAVILPMDVTKGKPLHPFVLQAIKKTWHLIFSGTVNLNSANDSFIERTLKDLTVKYVPYFQTKDSPMLKCLDGSETCGIIAEKISNSYFRHPVQEPESNVFKALRLICEFLKHTTNFNCANSVVKQTLYGIFEIVMFHSQRNSALDIIRAIGSASWYNQIKTLFHDILINVTEKHLAFNTLNYYQLLHFLAEIIPKDLKEWLSDVKKQINNVEKMRGVGYDKVLRQSLERLYSKLL